MIPAQEASMTPNYEVTQDLSQNEWQTLYRGYRLTDQKPVLLKTLRHGNQAIGFGELLEREFNLLCELSLEGVPHALELLHSGNGGCLVIEDGGGALLSDRLITRPMELGSFFKLAIRLSTTLAELHRQNITHRNLNPRGILHNPVTSEVWLTDLSLAVKSVDEVQ